MADIKLDIDSALADSLAHDPEDMLTRWIVVAEFMTPSGIKYPVRDWEASMMPYELEAFASLIADDGWED